MTKEEIKRVFNAGKASVEDDISFDEWYKEYEAKLSMFTTPHIRNLAQFYQECFVKLLDIPPSRAFNSRKEDARDIKHIIRWVLKEHYGKNLTYEGLSEIEFLAGADRKAHHTTLMNSISKGDQDLPNRRASMTREIKRIFNKYIL